MTERSGGPGRPAGNTCTRLAALLGVGACLMTAAGCGLAPRSEGAPVAASGSEGAAASVDGADAAQITGASLYARHCAACHGDDGGGDGPAAGFLYPRPRDFLDGQFRLVTTTNGVPSDGDLKRAIERGMPGSAMFPFGHLDDEELTALVEHVRGLVRDGLEEQLRREAEEFGEEFDDDELNEIIDLRTQPGEPLEVPDNLLASGPESVERGRALYLEQCASCHGETGRGDGVQVQVDNTGIPIRPRDFTRGIFKGGREPEQLYARIALGAPGTPMPASPHLQPSEVADLVHFLRSLSDPADTAASEHRRTRLVARRAELDLSNGDVTDNAWEAVEPSPILVSPLWWRDDAEPGLRVQALHDGRTLAVRLSWRDATHNTGAVRSQDFPDKAALQLARGGPEPFLGMGATGQPVEVWLWDASAQGDLGHYADVDSTYPEMIVDRYPFEEPTDGAAHPTDRQPREFLSAWAAGNTRSDPTRPFPGAGHAAEGPGTLTRYPIPSQAVTADGLWSEGRWAVVLRRPLRVEADDGGDPIALAPGDWVSISFALWDGAVDDRGGQKRISIWHDLELEPETTARSRGARR